MTTFTQQRDVSQESHSSGKIYKLSFEFLPLTERFSTRTQTSGSETQPDSLMQVSFINVTIIHLLY